MVCIVPLGSAQGSASSLEGRGLLLTAIDGARKVQESLRGNVSIYDKRLIVTYDST